MVEVKRLKVVSSKDAPILADADDIMPVMSTDFFKEPKRQVERTTKVFLGHIVSLVQLRDKETKKPYREIISGDLVDSRGEAFSRMEFRINNQGEFRLDLSKGREEVTGLGFSGQNWTVAERISMDGMDYVLVSSKDEVRELKEAFDFDNGALEFVEAADNRGRITSTNDPNDKLHFERYHMSAKDEYPEQWGIRITRRVGTDKAKLAEALGDKEQYFNDEIHIRWTDLNDHSTWRVFGRNRKKKPAKAPVNQAPAENASVAELAERLKGGLGG